MRKLNILVLVLIISFILSACKAVMTTPGGDTTSESESQIKTSYQESLGLTSPQHSPPESTNSEDSTPTDITSIPFETQGLTPNPQPTLKPTPTPSLTPKPSATPTPSPHIRNLLPRNAGPAGQVGNLPLMKLKKHDVLSINNGMFYLEGKPFVEISFNKFDLLWQLIDPLLRGDTRSYERMLIEQEKSLKELNGMGFRTIRVFMAPWAPEDLKDAYYNKKFKDNVLFKTLDDVIEMCERNDIKIVWSLGVAQFAEKWFVSTSLGWHWELGDYHLRELVADENSIARQEMYKYIDAVVQRYRNSKAVLMWEIHNELTLLADIHIGTRIYEGERMPTLADLGNFFDDVSNRIRANDPLRLINSGGSAMRPKQWNLTLGKNNLDTRDQQYAALELLYKGSACDIIDIHWYTNEKTGYEVSRYEWPGVWKTTITLKDYMDFAQRLGKPMMIGEIGLEPKQGVAGYFYDNASPQAVPHFQRQLDEIVEAGVQLSYWWQYGSDRPVDKPGPGQWTIKKGIHDNLLEMFIQANKDLRKKYGIE